MPTLTRDNKDDWFSIMHLYLELKDLWRLVARPNIILTLLLTGILSLLPLTGAPVTLTGFGDRKGEVEVKLAILQYLD